MHFVLSESDVILLRRLAQQAGPSFNFGIRGTEEYPDVEGSYAYIALTPSGGIDALTDHSGTASGSLAGRTIPGWAMCQIHQIFGVLSTSSTDPYLIPVMTLEQRVFNLSTTAIGAFAWILVVRDCFGQWIACTGGGVGSTGSVISDVYESAVTVEPNTVTPVPWTGTPSEFWDGTPNTDFVIPSSYSDDSLFFLCASGRFPETNPTADYGCGWFKNGDLTDFDYDDDGLCSGGPLKVSQSEPKRLNGDDYIQFCVYHNDDQARLFNSIAAMVEFKPGN